MKRHYTHCLSWQNVVSFDLSLYSLTDKFFMRIIGNFTVAKTQTQVQPLESVSKMLNRYLCKKFGQDFGW